MYKQTLFTLFCTLLPLYFWGQAPRWISSEGRRMLFPESVYVAGFAESSVRPDETVATATDRLKKEAQGLLSDGIRVKVESERKSYSKSASINDSEELSALFESAVTTSSAAEIVGVKTDAYFSPSDKMVYAVAYAKRQELMDYYQGDITLGAQRIEGFFRAAAQLEKQGYKVKARKQYEEAVPLLAKINHAQDMLIALSKGGAAEGVQQERAEALLGELRLALARLAQSVSVFVESSENIFGQTGTAIVANKLKAALAKKSGCIFTDDASQSDFKLTLSVTTRKIGEQGTLVFCYADVTVDLVDSYTGKSVYQDEISQKGGSTSSYERAGRQACEDAAPKVADKITPWVKEK
ncbi:MAG: hypothetical protein LBF55_04705 [Prevotellaceae bacterium]|jgi:hypothetical protein|nr:hypothetical protein [Prevotellaceae bacterium]